jgi:FkbM family methyltransferase
MHVLSDRAGDVRVEVEMNQWLGAAELRQLQLDRINALLEHAVERVPFHRKRLATHTGRAPRLRSLDELVSLPTLTKADIQSNFEAMQAAGVSREGWHKNATGGSTGEPLVFYRDRRAQTWVDAACERFRRWLGAVDEDKLALIWGADRDFPARIPPNQKWLNVFTCREEDIERFILDLATWQPRTIRGYATSLHLVSRFIQSRQLPSIRPHAVESSAETLTPEMRREIEAAFGAPVFNFYGSREISCIACEDQAHDGLRVADDIRLLEIIRGGRPAGPGDDGAIVITDLVNYAMPLIRYEIGDVGIAPAMRPAASRETDCRFSTIAHVQGRTANTITAPDGRLIHGEFFTHLFYHKPGIRMFQVRQAGSGALEIVVVPGDGFQPSMMDGVTSSVREHVGAGVGIGWRAAEDIPATPTGKRMFTVSEIPVRFVETARKPRILFLADRRGWAFDINARGIAEALRDEFEFRIDYVAEQPDLRAWDYDLLVVMFWGETYHRRFAPDPRKVIKQISSHRWALEEQFGRLQPAQMAERYLDDATTVIVPSRRLREMFAQDCRVFLTPKGITPSGMPRTARPDGPLRVGWVGNRKDPCKGLEEILLPAVGDDFELRIAGGDVSASKMTDFYHSIDVLLVASTAEGDPRPLIEGMACGCFPVAVDVGIVPELVEHGVNGLIVERSAAAFRAALQWCRCNVDFVRQAGESSAARVRERRSWSAVAPSWRDAFRAALREMEMDTDSNTDIRTDWQTAAASAFGRDYAKEAWDSRQPALETAFRRASGSPHAPAGYQDAVTHALEALRPHHKTIVDVGAWLGSFVLNAAAVNPQATIFALEPEPANFSFLARRAPANVVPLRMAVGRECGESDMLVSGNSQGHTIYRELMNATHGDRTPVRTIRADQLLGLVGGSVDFMKINAEGAEFDILRSPAFQHVREAIVEVHLEGTQGVAGGERLLADVAETHAVDIVADLSPRFLFVHLTRRPGLA